MLCTDLVVHALLVELFSMWVLMAYAYTCQTLTASPAQAALIQAIFSHSSSSERPKPPFWFRPDTETETVIGRYFWLIP